MVVCIPCHELYEKMAYELKQKLAVEFQMPLGGGKQCVNEDVWRVRKAASALQRAGDTMPEARRQELLKCVQDHYGKPSISEEEIKEAAGLEHRISCINVQHGEHVVSKLSDLEAFVGRWWKHFLETMKPQFLPEGWSLSRSIWKKD